MHTRRRGQGTGVACEREGRGLQAADADRGRGRPNLPGRVGSAGVGLEEAGLPGGVEADD